MKSQELALLIIVSYCTDDEVRKRTDAGIWQQRWAWRTTLVRQNRERRGTGGTEIHHEEKGQGDHDNRILAILAAKVLQSQWIRRGVKEPSSAKQESGRIWMFHCSYNRAGGGGKVRGQVPAQYWFWYIGFGCGWWESLEQGVARGCLCHAGAWKTKRSLQGLRLNCRNAWCCWG